MPDIRTPWRQARVAAGLTLVDVAARARCALNTAAKYDIAGPDAVSEKTRPGLDAVYTPLLNENASHP